VVFGTVATLDLSRIVLVGNSGISKDQGISYWNFVPNSRHRENFATALMHVDRQKYCHSIRWTLSVVILNLPHKRVA